MTDQGIKAPTPAATGEGATDDKINYTRSIHTQNEKVNISPLLKAADVARYLSVSRTEAYRLMKSEIPVIRFGASTVRVQLSDLERFIENSRCQNE